MGCGDLRLEIRKILCRIPGRMLATRKSPSTRVLIEHAVMDGKKRRKHDAFLRQACGVGGK